MIRFVATLVPVGYFLVLFCLPLLAVSTPSDAKVQFSNKKNFDRVPDHNRPNVNSPQAPPQSEYQANG